MWDIILCSYGNSGQACNSKTSRHWHQLRQWYLTSDALYRVPTNMSGGGNFIQVLQTLWEPCYNDRYQCRRKTFIVHQTFVWWALYIPYKFVKFPIRHLGLAIGNVRCVRRFSPTLQIWVDIGSGNGFLPDGTKPLLEPMFTCHQICSVAISQEVLMNFICLEITLLRLVVHFPGVNEL